MFELSPSIFGRSQGGSYFRRQYTAGVPAPVVLSRENAPAVVRAYERLSSVEWKDHSGLAIGLRRFRDARLRQDAEDTLIDLMVSAEAIAPRSGGGIAHRLAYAAALWWRQEGQTPSDVRRFVRTAYAARSDIVHGESPRRLTRLGGAAATLNDVIEDLEDLVRTGCDAALTAALVGGQPPDIQETLDELLDAGRPSGTSVEGSNPGSNAP